MDRFFVLGGCWRLLLLIWFRQQLWSLCLLISYSVVFCSLLVDAWNSMDLSQSGLLWVLVCAWNSMKSNQNVIRTNGCSGVTNITRYDYSDASSVLWVCLLVWKGMKWHHSCLMGPILRWYTDGHLCSSSHLGMLFGNWISMKSSIKKGKNARMSF